MIPALQFVVPALTDIFNEWLQGGGLVLYTIDVAPLVWLANQADPECGVMWGTDASDGFQQVEHSLALGHSADE